MTSETFVDHETLRTQLLEVIDANPDNVNPVDGNSCTYRKMIAGEIHNCVIGKWAVVFGHDLPGANATASDAFDIFSPKAACLADAAQRAADNSRIESGYLPCPVRWETIREGIVNWTPSDEDWLPGFRN